jgi:hypothetical protein
MARLRNRIVKADFWNDSELLRWPRDKRFTYQGLWASAEDSGCIEDDPFGWKLMLWPSPLDADITVERLAQWRSEMVDVGKLIPYESNGKACLYLRTFHHHESPRNPQAPNLPLPPWVLWETSTVERKDGGRGSRYATNTYTILEDLVPQPYGKPDATITLPYHNPTESLIEPLSGPVLSCPALPGTALPGTVLSLSEGAEISALADFKDIDFEDEAVDEGVQQQLLTQTPVEPPVAPPKPRPRKPMAPDTHTREQLLLAHWIDNKTERGLTLADRIKGRMAKVLGEQCKVTSSDRVIEAAIEKLEEKGLRPELLPDFVNDIERSGSASDPEHDRLKRIRATYRDCGEHAARAQADLMRVDFEEVLRARA